jgi:hypothetical protein
MGRSLRRQVLAGFLRPALVAAAGVACAGAGAPGAGTDSRAAREHSCGFELITDRPGPEYVEIARIALEGDTNFGAGAYRSTQHYAKAVREMVCEVGGDAVKNEVDGFGVVVRVIVFQRVREGQGSRARPGPAPAEPSEPTCPAGSPCDAGTRSLWCVPSGREGETCSDVLPHE